MLDALKVFKGEAIPEAEIARIKPLYRRPGAHNREDGTQELGRHHLLVGRQQLQFQPHLHVRVHQASAVLA
jgi:hypothetical protein